MSCCKKLIEDKVKQRVAVEHKQAKDVTVHLLGYNFVTTESGLDEVPVHQAEVVMDVPNRKGGGYRRVRSRIPVSGAFCPFCGKKLKEPNG